MIRVPTPLERRAAAAQQLLDDWRDRPLDWKARNHCGRVAAEHLRRMGYKPPIAKAGDYKSELGALRALKRLGVATLGDALDGMGLVHIPPAAAIVGDFIELPSASKLGCLTVAMGNGRVGGWVEGAEGFAVLQPQEYARAWRVDPR